MAKWLKLGTVQSEYECKNDLVEAEFQKYDKYYEIKNGVRQLKKLCRKQLKQAITRWLANRKMIEDAKIFITECELPSKKTPYLNFGIGPSSLILTFKLRF